MALHKGGTIMVKKGNSLIPFDALTYDALNNIKEGQKVWVQIRKPRNIEHHRKFFALIGVVFPNQSTWATQDQFREALLIAAGYGEPYEAMIENNGKMIKGIVYKAKSISFDALDQNAFTEVYDACVAVILKRILPNVNKDDLERVVHDILVGRK